MGNNQLERKNQQIYYQLSIKYNERKKMTPLLKANNYYIQSDSIAQRNLHGEFLIVPIYEGLANEEDAIFSLNTTGKEIWDMFTGTNTLKEISAFLAKKYNENVSKIEKDIIGLAEELLKRDFIVEKKCSN